MTPWQVRRLTGKGAAAPRKLKASLSRDGRAALIDRTVAAMPDLAQRLMACA